MPQLNAQPNVRIVAQAEPSGGAEHGQLPALPGQTHETVGHGAGHGGEHAGPHNPLAEHPAGYYSLMGLFAALIIVAFAAVTTAGRTRRTPSKKQALIEQCVESIRVFCRNAIGEGGERFAPLIGTIFAFVLVSNLFGIIPLVIGQTGEGLASISPAPTANLSMTLAISLIVFVVVQYVGIKENGLAGYLKHFAGPIPALAPLIFIIEIVGAFVKPISLSMRLFGNVFGEETVIAVLVGLAFTTLPRFVPIPFQFPMLMFGVFGSIVQAGVYTILTCAYIALSLGDHDDHGHGAEHNDIKDEFGAHVPSPARAH